MACRHGQYEQLDFKPCMKMGKKKDLGDFKGGARKVNLGISLKADRQVFSPITTSMVYREIKQKKRDLQDLRRFWTISVLPARCSPMGTTIFKQFLHCSTVSMQGCFVLITVIKTSLTHVAKKKPFIVQVGEDQSFCLLENLFISESFDTRK